MANITPGEARIGWGVFLASNGQISQDELQAEVDQFSIAISDRMFRHYRALFAAGYDHYIPINRFDILQAAEPFGNESANSRYKYSDVGSPVRVTVLRDDPFTFLAVAARVSDAGLTLQVDEPTVGTMLTKSRSKLRVGEYLRADFLQGRQPSAEGRLVDKPEVHPAGDSWLLEVEFNRLRSVVEFTDGEPMDVDVCPVRLNATDGGAVAADVLGRRLYHLLDAVENVRAMFNDVADRQALDYRRRVYPARVSHVTMDSPIELTILVPVGVVGILGLVYSVMKGGPIAFKTVQDGRLSGAQARKERALAESVELSNAVKRAAVQQAIRRHLAVNGANLTPETETSRLFDNAFEQLSGNIAGLAQELVTGLELPTAAEEVMDSQPDLDGEVDDGSAPPDDPDE